MLTWILENPATAYTVATSVLGTAAALAAITPTPKDDGIVAALRKVLDLLACNFGNARNAK